MAKKNIMTIYGGIRIEEDLRRTNQELETTQKYKHSTIYENTESNMKETRE